MRARSVLSVVCLGSMLLSGCSSGGSGPVSSSAGAPIVPAATSVNRAAPIAERVVPETALRGNFVSPLPSATRVDIFVQLNGQNLDKIDALIQAQNTPGSPSYHQYLTPSQYGAKFGATSQDYNEALTTLRSYGLTVDKAMPNQRDILAHGTATAVEGLIHSPIDQRSENGRTFYTNRYVEQLPASLHAYAIAGTSDWHQVHPFNVHSNTTIAGVGGFGARDIESVYDLKPVYATATGKGVTEIDATEGLARESDFAGFNDRFGLHATLVSTVVGDKAPIDYNGETTLDVEYAAAIAPDVTIDQVTAANQTDAAFNAMYSYIVNSMSDVHIVSTSWGDCEAQYGSSLGINESDFQQAAAEGQWWLSAAGDDGVDDCGDKTKGVDFPGSSPYVVSVGGTTVTPSATDGGEGGAYTGWQSEVVWDDKSDNGGAGGGGISKVFAEPSFQAPLATGATMREVPDVSLMADDCDAPSGTSVCSKGADGGYFVYLEGTWENGWGGTSFAAPEWGAFLTLVQQKYRTTRITSPLARLYALAGEGNYTSYFHDIVSGCNSYDTITGFCAGTGYDAASGLGSFQGAALQAAY